MNRTSSSAPGAPGRAAFLALLCSAAGWTCFAATPPPWHYVGRIGLFDTHHTAADGRQGSDIVALGRGDHTLGTSDRFAGADDVRPESGRRAQSGWVASPGGSTYRIGLYDAAHTRDDGRQETYPLLVNGSGVSTGTSTRFIGHGDAGESAWVATATGSTVRIGFYDARHTASGGRTRSVPVDLNNGNKLIGFSENPETGQRSAWIANASGQIGRIGIVDTAHTAPSGHQASFPVALNDDGYIVGNSDYFGAGGWIPGATAWLRRPDRTMRVIGFQSGVHAGPGGQHVSRAESLTETGFIAGWSARYGGGSSDSIGQTAWLTHVDGPNRPVGFYTGDHVGPTGSVHSQIVAVNERGYAMGTSFQYDGTGSSEFDQAGATAWIATPAGATIRVGFYDAEHSINGHQFNEVIALNGIDALVGATARYRPDGAYHGMSAFVANAAGYTARLGLLDGVHVRRDGHRVSRATHITDASGHVAGFSERYGADGRELGQTAWIYTRGARTYVTIELSVRPSDGYAESHITHLREDGTAVGYFRSFDNGGNDLGDRAFAHVPSRGTFVLDTQLDTPPSAAGWLSFADAVATSAGGAIVGTGAFSKDTAYGHGVYLLNQETASSLRR